VHFGLEKGVCHVDLAVVFMASTVVKDIFNEWKRMIVSYSVQVEFAVVVYPLGKDCGVSFWDNECG
jgi:hypothetical protein